jgi:hypothetical protein
MNQIIKFNQKDIINKLKVIEKLLNDDLKKGLFHPEKLLYREAIKKQVVDLFLEHWKDNFGEIITLYRGTKYGGRTKKERRVDVWKIYPTTINPLIAYKFAKMTTMSFNEKQIPIVIEYEFELDDLKDKLDSVPFHFINVGSGFFGLEESEMEFTFKSKPLCEKKNYYKPLIGFRFRKIDNTEMKENNKMMITSFKLFENINQKPVEVGEYLYHRSDIKNRDSIKENGLFPKTGVRRLGVDKYKIDAIFATDSSKKEEWFDSTFDDDCWRIDTSKIPDVVWYKDLNMGGYGSRNHHVMTLQSIPPDALQLIYEGTGRDTLFEGVTPKSEVQTEIDCLIDKGIENLNSKEIEFLKNPYKPKPESKLRNGQDIMKYYGIASNFFEKVIGTDIRNYELNDDLTLFDILANEEEVDHVVNIIFYKYHIQIDPENNDNYKLVDIFKRIYERIKK